MKDLLPVIAAIDAQVGQLIDTGMHKEDLRVCVNPADFKRLLMAEVPPEYRYAHRIQLEVDGGVAPGEFAVRRAGQFFAQGVYDFYTGRKLPDDFDPHFIINTGARVHVVPSECLLAFVRGDLRITDIDDAEEILRKITADWMSDRYRETRNL